MTARNGKQRRGKAAPLIEDLLLLGKIEFTCAAPYQALPAIDATAFAPQGTAVGDTGTSARSICIPDSSIPHAHAPNVLANPLPIFHPLPAMDPADKSRMSPAAVQTEGVLYCAGVHWGMGALPQEQRRTTVSD